MAFMQLYLLESQGMFNLGQICHNVAAVKFDIKLTVHIYSDTACIIWKFIFTTRRGVKSRKAPRTTTLQIFTNYLVQITKRK